MATPVTGFRATYHRPAIAGAAIASVGATLALGTVVLTIVDRQSPPTYTLAGLDVNWSLAIRTTVQTVGLITMTLISGVVVWRRPRAALSLLFLVLAAAIVLQAFASQYAIHGLLVSPGSLPLAELAAWSQQLIPPLGLMGGAGFLLLFPDGRPASRRWWLLLGLAIMVLAAEVLSALDDPYPLNIGTMALVRVPVTMPPALWAIGAWMNLGSGVIAWTRQGLAIAFAVYLLRRLRTASGESRQQLKWFAYAATIYLVTSLLAITDNPPPLDWLPSQLHVSVQQFAGTENAHAVASWSILLSWMAGLVLLPAAIGVAMVRYRLYDIDIVINRTILYGGLAVFVTAGYAIVVGGVGSLLGQRAGLNPLLSVATIAVLAVLLLPVRSRLHDLADLAVYGKRARPYDVLSDFAESIGHAESAQVLLPRMAELLRQGTGATGTEVWARVGDGLQLAAASPPIEAPAAVADAEQIGARHAGAASVEPVFHDGQMLGALVVVKPRGEELNAVERRLFRDVASQAGLVLTRFRLVQELRESRARIVASQDVERHRIERNLHDGAQQRFVNALLSLGMAQAEGEHDSGRSNFLVEASREVQAGLNELRNLARGLQPPLLSESGIVAASTALADAAPIATTVIARIPDRRYPQGIETAAYFVVSESLTNAARHSQARNVSVTIDEVAGRLSVEVRDDGVGGVEIGAGSGIIGLQDRVAAVGGRLSVESPKGGGTIVRAELPCT